MEKTNLTKNEIRIMKCCLNYQDRENQISDNYSNGDMQEFRAEFKGELSDKGIGGVISSLQKKNMAYMDNSDASFRGILWLTEDGVNALFDIIDAEKEETKEEEETPADKIMTNDKVRSYDFPGREDCYVEGIVEEIGRFSPYFTSCEHYKIRVTKKVFAGEEEDLDTWKENHTSNPDFPEGYGCCFPPINGTLSFTGPTDFVKKITTNYSLNIEPLKKDLNERIEKNEVATRYLDDAGELIAGEIIESERINDMINETIGVIMGKLKIDEETNPKIDKDLIEYIRTAAYAIVWDKIRENL